MQEKVVGIVTDEINYGETSKIIHLLTKDKGIIGVMAKGAKTMKSSLRSVSGKLIYGEFDIYYKKDKLSILSSVSVINDFRNIRKDIKKISYASFILELSVQVYKQNSDENIFDLLISALEKINDNYDSQIIMNIIELKYLEYLGIMPIINECAVCHNKTGIVTLSSHRGGYICKNCLKSEKIVSPKTVKLIRLLYYVDLSKISKIEVSEIAKREINLFLDEYYDEYTGLYLNTKKFINSLNNI